MKTSSRRFFWQGVGLTFATIKPCCIASLLMSATSTGASIGMWGHRLDELLLWWVAVPLLTWAVWDFGRGLFVSMRRGIALNATLVCLKAVALCAALGMTVANANGWLPWQHRHDSMTHDSMHHH